jgi:hypothetical protein
MSSIPEAREQLLQAADEVEAEGMTASAEAIRSAVALLYRRPYARARAPARSVYADASLAAEIRQMARTYPEMPLQKIAEAFGVNAGRVSEALQGLR